jgi:hypothetical protein
MWARRRADEAPLPRAAEGRRTRGIHQAAADEAPLSSAGAFFSTQYVPLVAGQKKLNRRFTFSGRRQDFPLLVGLCIPFRYSRTTWACCLQPGSPRAPPVETPQTAFPRGARLGRANNQQLPHYIKQFTASITRLDHTKKVPPKRGIPITLVKSSQISQELLVEGEIEAARSVNHRGLPGGGGLWV